MPDAKPKPDAAAVLSSSLDEVEAWAVHALHEITRAEHAVEHRVAAGVALLEHVRHVRGR